MANGQGTDQRSLALAFGNIQDQAVPNSYAFMDRWAQRHDDQARIKALAGQGAQQLMQYGDEGRQWAMRLVQNPVAAMQLANSYGGIGEIERRLAMGQATGVNAQRGDLERAILHQEGSKGIAQYGAGLGQMMNAQGMLGTTQAQALRNEMIKESAGYKVIEDYMRKAVGAHAVAMGSGNPVTQGAADFVLVQALGKMIDPNSVVRNEEGELIAQSGSTQLQNIIRDLNSMAGLKSGILHPTARAALLDQIKSAYKAGREKQQRFYDTRLDEFGSFGMQGNLLNYAMPADINPDEHELLAFGAGGGGKVTPQQEFELRLDAAEAQLEGNPDKPVIVQDPTDGTSYIMRVIDGKIDIDRVK